MTTHHGQHIGQELLIQSIVAMGIKHAHGGPTLSQSDLKADIEFAIQQGYLRRFGDHVTVGPRVGRELGYLEILADRCIHDSGTK